MGVILLIAAVFGLCYLADKGFTKLFRSAPQHASGLSLRPSKRYGSMGLIVACIGIAGLITGITDGSTAMCLGSGVLLLSGTGLAFYYLSTGIFYDEDTFLSTSMLKKSRTYRYTDIAHQQLYAVQGGHYIIELHMTDHSSVMIQSQMENYQHFLSHASEKWQEHHGAFSTDPEHLVWFPDQEEN